MPLYHSYTDENFTHLIWEINEDEKFFLSKFSLTDKELEIIKSKKTSIKKIEFLSVRYLLRLLKINPNDLSYSKDGAPQLKTGTNISISHSSLPFSTFLSNIEMTAAQPLIQLPKILDFEYSGQTLRYMFIALTK